MKKSINALIILVFSIFFVVIFYNQDIGLNLFLYNLVLLALLSCVYKVFDFRNKTHVAVASGAMLSALGTLYHGSHMVLIMNYLSLILLLGIVNNGHLKVLANLGVSAIAQLFSGIFYFFKNECNLVKKGGRSVNLWSWTGIIIIPVIILVIFYNLYSASSSKFSSAFGFLGEFISDFFVSVFGNINFSIFFLFIFGFILSCAYFVKTKVIALFNEPLTDALLHKKKYRYSGSVMGLLSEFRIGVITLGLLNILLAIFNALDIWSVWIHFEWNGELLKEFVHEGTYTLIFTLFISVGLVLIFFRKSLNFFSKNKPLKILANIWLIQNMVMALSVLIRNLHYINYYNLAYLRIGVLLFIVIVFFGLITVLIKVNATKNFYYLFRVNMLFAYMALIIFSLADWDVIIAQFNFSRSEKALVHLNFMSGLSDKALPYLDRTEEEIKKIDQNSVYKAIGRESYFMKSDEYLGCIQKRKRQFLENYPQRTFFEWNYADYKAYKKLSDK